MHTLIIATSTNPGSRSQHLARHFAGVLAAAGDSHELIDLRELPLPRSGPGGGKREDANVARLAAAIEPATHIVFAVPIYCYDVNAVAKQVIELVGKQMAARVVGFICSAGGGHSYMSVMGFANHLMLDFRCVVCPRYVYATKGEVDEAGAPSQSVRERLERLREDLAAIRIAAGALV